MASSSGSCFCCSLRTGSFLVALYTFILAILLLSFNTYDFIHERDFIFWSRIVSFVFAIALLVAAISLLVGLNKNSTSLMNVWMIVFVVYALLHAAFIIWNIANLNAAPSYHPIPISIRSSVLANVIVFSILVVINVLSIITVRRYMKES